MKQITAYNNPQTHGLGFTTRDMDEKEADQCIELFHTSITDNDFAHMQENMEYAKQKVAKLLKNRPFNTNEK